MLSYFWFCSLDVTVAQNPLRRANQQSDAVFEFMCLRRKVWVSFTDVSVITALSWRTVSEKHTPKSSYTWSYWFLCQGQTLSLPFPSEQRLFSSRKRFKAALLTVNCRMRCNTSSTSLSFVTFQTSIGTFCSKSPESDVTVKRNDEVIRFSKLFTIEDVKSVSCVCIQHLLLRKPIQNLAQQTGFKIINS